MDGDLKDVFKPLLHMFFFFFLPFLLKQYPDLLRVVLNVVFAPNFTSLDQVEDPKPLLTSLAVFFLCLICIYLIKSFLNFVSGRSCTTEDVLHIP